MLDFIQHFPYSESPRDATCTELSGFGTPGETVSLSFSVAASAYSGGLVVHATSLTSETHCIPQNRIETYVVRRWTQAGIGVYQADAMEVPELLVKDDSQSLADGYRRRYKLKPGPRWSLRSIYQYQPPDIRLSGPAKTLLEPGETKQIWVSVTVPDDCPPGLYRGKVQIRTNVPAQKTIDIPVVVQVLGFRLYEPDKILLLWFRGTLDWQRSSQHYLPVKQFKSQLQDIRRHGFRSITLNENNPNLAQRAVDIAEAVGFDQYVVFHPPYPKDPHKLRFKKLKPVFYLSDEMDMHGDGAVMAHQRHARQVDAWGGTSFCSLFHNRFVKRLQDPQDIGHLPNVVSLYLPANLDYFFLYSQFADVRHTTTCYYWLTHMEKPNVHRVLAGLYLYRSQADGITPYCYQHLPQYPYSPYDDFDQWEPGFHVGEERRPFKDHMTTYPARRGSVPTVQWEGLREGIQDLKYLTTLEHLIRCADASGNPELKHRGRQAHNQLQQMLKAIDLKAIQIADETGREPYPHLSAQDFHEIRHGIAQLVAHCLQADNREAGVC